MVVRQRNDQVFQLSLTEIAFTIAFILLLLLGYVVVREQRDRIAAEKALSEVLTAKAATAAMQEASATLKGQLGAAGASNPDEVISKLVAEASVALERDTLKVRVDDLEKEVSTLVEVGKLVDSVGKEAGFKELRNQIVSAIALQKDVEKSLLDSSELSSVDKPAPAESLGDKDGPQNASKASMASLTPAEISDGVKRAILTKSAFQQQLHEATGRTFPKGQEAAVVSEVVQAAKATLNSEVGGVSVQGMRKENADLRGQLQFYKARLEAKGGRDYPPCWANEAGRVEFLFSIELRSDGAVVSPRWPESRNADAAALPGVGAMTAAPIALSNFPAASKPILDWGKKQDPECRHYVQLKSTISDAVQSDRARLMVENYFYKVEVRR
jgi:hypothetical protein